MIRISIAITLFAMLASPLQALPSTCEDKDTQLEMNICAQLDFEAQDKKLDGVFSRAMVLMKITDRELEVKRNGAVDAIRTGQKAWLKSRDKTCEAEGFLYRGGTMEPHIFNSCRAGLTRARIKYLEQVLEGNE